MGLNALVPLLLAVAVAADPEVAWNITGCSQNPAPCRQGVTDTRECEVVCFENRTCEIRVALIFPNDTGYIVNLQAAAEQVQEAVDEAKRRELLSPNITIKYSFYDDKCQQEYATINALYAYSDECSHVMFGPICDYPLAGTGRIAKFLGMYGTPIITSGGFTFDFTKEKISCDNEFYMLLNSGTVDYRSLSEVFVHVAAQNRWSKIAVVYEKFDQNEVGGSHGCQLLMKSVIQDVSHNMTYTDGDLNLTTIAYHEYLKREIGTDYGIILLCASRKNVRKMLIEAVDLNMIGSGEYLFFNYELYSNAEIPSQPWYDSNDTQENNDKVKTAYRSVYTLTPWSEAEMTTDDLVDNTNKGAIYLEGIYDGMLMYAHIINHTLQADEQGLLPNQSIRGVEVIGKAFGLNFTGKREEITMNCNGQRVAKYAVMQMNSQATRLEIVAEYNTLGKTFTHLKDFRWPNGGTPLDSPTCGFDMSLCPTISTMTIVLVVVCICLPSGLVIMSVFLYRRYKLDAEIAAMTWKVHWDDILWFPNTKLRSSFHSTGSLPRRGSMTTISVTDGSLAGDRQLYTTVAYYKGIRVAVKKLDDAKIELNRSQLFELKVMKDLTSDHLVKFYGACIESPHCCILNEYCPRGSLQDVLENEEVQLDFVFRLSLIQDVIKGMHYLHNTPIKSHGSLKSSNCLVDSRFVLKIADFGMHFLRLHINDGSHDEQSHSYWERQLWTAPELLRVKNPPVGGTQKGDVYSFAIIVHEIITRQGVFYLGPNCNLTKKEIVDGVRNAAEVDGHPLRPLIGENTCDDDVAKLMKQCWAEDSADRPDFSVLKNTIRKLNKEYDSGNVLDNLLSRMEQYANNLEALVEERTADYLEEKRRCEELLYQLLPKSVAQQLITGESVIAETFDQVTIYFSDIVGFTALSAQSTPLQVVDLLNDLYTCFDSIIENFDVYKVETIGDAYMVVSGLPERNGNKHAREIARMSLALLNAVQKFKIRHRPDEPLKLRIGIHTGPCVAGVVGLRMPRYCLFGDTVNTASRMESNGQPLRIHVSPATKEVLDTFGMFLLECRGEVEMKGKGKMTTYWLNGEISETVNNSEPISFSKNKKVFTCPVPNSSVNTYTKKETCSTTDVGRALNTVGNREISPSNHQQDEADVPLLSITSPYDSYSQV